MRRAKHRQTAGLMLRSGTPLTFLFGTSYNVSFRVFCLGICIDSLPRAGEIRRALHGVAEEDGMLAYFLAWLLGVSLARSVLTLSFFTFLWFVAKAGSSPTRLFGRRRYRWGYLDLPLFSVDVDMCNSKYYTSFPSINRRHSNTHDGQLSISERREKFLLRTLSPFPLFNAYYGGKSDDGCFAAE